MALICDAPVRASDVPFDWDAVVVGVARPATGGWSVRHLFLDHHPLADAVAARIEADARARFGVGAAFLAHRVGRIQAGQAIVVCAARGADPAAARDAAQWMLESTKRHLPVWKMEVGPAGSRWMEGHPLAAGAQAAAPTAQLTQAAQVAQAAAQVAHAAEAACHA